MSNTPESPPAPPVIPVGIATKLGLAGTLLLVFCSALTAVLKGYHGHDTRLLATLATVLAVATILGRCLQAAAALFRNPSVANLAKLESFAAPLDTQVTALENRLKALEAHHKIAAAEGAAKPTVKPTAKRGGRAT